MKNNTFFKVDSWLVLIFSLLFIMPCSDALARDRRGHREVVVYRHNKYHYYDGRFYSPSWFGFEFRIGSPPVGIAVSTLPYGCLRLSHRGVTYYYYDNVYYQPYGTSYVVVSPPPVDYGDKIVVNVPNSRGGFTVVTLTKSGGGYIGPQGEFYSGNPTMEQLKALYGR
jgi:hypothetical protein